EEHWLCYHSKKHCKFHLLRLSALTAMFLPLIPYSNRQYQVSLHNVPLQIIFLSFPRQSLPHPLSPSHRIPWKSESVDPKIQDDTCASLRNLVPKARQSNKPLSPTAFFDEHPPKYPVRYQCQGNPENL